jgi:hypothetical protein
MKIRFKNEQHLVAIFWQWQMEDNLNQYERECVVEFLSPYDLDESLSDNIYAGKEHYKKNWKFPAKFPCILIIDFGNFIFK